jgi:ASC-1-like (ASCH) protein
MAKALTYQEFMDYAKKHYNRGGDSYYECWDEKTFKMFYPDGITKSEALKMFRREYDHEKDVAGYWKY